MTLVGNMLNSEITLLSEHYPQSSRKFILSEIWANNYRTKAVYNVPLGMLHGQPLVFLTLRVLVVFDTCRVCWKQMQYVVLCYKCCIVNLE